MNRVFVALLILGLLIGAFTIGWLMGFDKGALSALLIDGPPRSVVALGNLKNLDEGNIQSVRRMLEHDFDKGILNYGAFKKAWFRPLVEYTSMNEAVIYSEGVMPLLAKHRLDMGIQRSLQEHEGEVEKVLKPYVGESPSK